MAMPGSPFSPFQAQRLLLPAIRPGSRLNGVRIRITADGRPIPTIVRSYVLPQGRISLGLAGQQIYAARLNPEIVRFGGGQFEMIPTISIATDPAGRQTLNLNIYTDNRTSGMFATPLTAFQFTMEWQEGGQTQQLTQQKYISCLDPSTPIMLHDGQQAPIGELVPGEYVANPLTGAGMRIAAIIRGPEPIPLIAVTTRLGTIRFSREHPVPTDSGYKQAARIQRGDALRDCDGTRQLVLDARPVPPKPGQLVYNLRFDHDSCELNDHLFLAGGIVVGDYWLQDRLREAAAGTAETLPARPAA